MATHSSVLAWITPGTAESGGLPSVGSHRVGHDWSDLAAASPASPVSGDKDVSPSAAAGVPPAFNLILPKCRYDSCL